MIDGINHITFAVCDLDRSFDFYANLLGLKAVARWPGGAYLLAGNTWIALNVGGEFPQKPLPDYTHVAFNVPPEDYPGMVESLRKAGVRTFKENTSPGESFYFFDPDGHKLELHYNTLEQRLSWMKNKGEVF